MIDILYGIVFLYCEYEIDMFDIKRINLRIENIYLFICLIIMCFCSSYLFLWFVYIDIYWVCIGKDFMSFGYVCVIYSGLFVFDYGSGWFKLWML